MISARIGRSCEAFSQIAEFIRAQLPVAGQLECVLNDFSLLVRRQAVHFFNYFGCCHKPNSTSRCVNFKRRRSVATTDHAPAQGGRGPHTLRHVEECQLAFASMDEAAWGHGRSHKPNSHYEGK